MATMTAKEAGFANRIYAAEAELRLTKRESVPVKDLQKVIKKLQTSTRVARVVFAQPAGWHLTCGKMPVINFGEGNNGGGFYNTRYRQITLHTYMHNGVRCFTHQTLIHELAHHIAFNRYGAFQDSAHGAGFVTALLELYRAVYGVQVQKELKNLCANYGIKMINSQGKKVKVRSAKTTN